MATVIDALLVTLGLDKSSFESGTVVAERSLDHLHEHAENTVHEIESVLGELGEHFLGLAEKIGGYLGVGLSLYEVKEKIQETAAEYVDLGKLAEQFHSTAEAIDEFANSGKLLGMSNDVTIGSLKELDKAVQDTALGLGRAGRIFEELGIQVKDAAGHIKPTTEVMAELATKFKGMERGTQLRIMERLNLNPALLKLFNSDLTDMQKRIEGIDKATGFSLERATENSKEFTKASKAMHLEINTLLMYFDKLFQTAYIEAMPALAETMTSAKEYIAEFVDFVEEHKDLVVGALIAIGAAVTYFILPPLIESAIAAWATVAPFLAIGLAIASVIAIFAVLYEDWSVWLKGGKSELGDFWQYFADVWHEIGGTVMEIVDEIKTISKDLFDTLGGFLKLFAALFFGNNEDIARAWGVLWDDMGKLAYDIFDGLLASLGRLMGALAPRIWNALKAGAEAFTEWLGGRLDLIGAYFDSIAPHAMGVFRDIRDDIVGVFAIIGDAWNILYALLTGDWHRLGDAVGELGRDMLLFITTAFDGIRNVAIIVIDAIMSAINSTLDAIKALWDALWAGIKNTALDVLDWLENKLDILKNAFAAIGHAISSAVSALPNNAKQDLNTGDKAYDDAQRALNAAAPATAASSVPGSSIMNTDTTTVTKQTHVGEVNIYTQATDAHGIADAITPALRTSTMADQADGGMM